MGHKRYGKSNSKKERAEAAQIHSLLLQFDRKSQGPKPKSKENASWESWIPKNEFSRTASKENNLIVVEAAEEGKGKLDLIVEKVHKDELVKEDNENIDPLEKSSSSWSCQANSLIKSREEFAFYMKILNKVSGSTLEKFQLELAGRLVVSRDVYSFTCFVFRQAVKNPKHTDVYGKLIQGISKRFVAWNELDLAENMYRCVCEQCACLFDNLNKIQSIGAATWLTTLKIIGLIEDDHFMSVLRPLIHSLENLKDDPESRIIRLHVVLKAFMEYIEWMLLLENRDENTLTKIRDLFGDYLLLFQNIKPTFKSYRERFRIQDFLDQCITI